VTTVGRAEAARPDPGFDLGEVDRLLTTTRSVRRRLDRQRTVPLALVLDALAVAVQAPTSENRQDWRWLVVTDPTVRADIGAAYRRACATTTPPASSPADRQEESAAVLAEHLDEVPVLVVVGYRRCRWHARSSHRAVVDATVYGSLYPAVWSLQLALRARGLASCFVAAHLRYAEDVARAVSLPDDIAQAGLVAVAWPDRDHFRPARRRPLTEVVRFDRWDDADVASSVRGDDGMELRGAGRL
jgi:nitroreductase